MRNGSPQGAYLIVAARALGLDCGPMSGFDNAAARSAHSDKFHVIYTTHAGSPSVRSLVDRRKGGFYLRDFLSVRDQGSEAGIAMKRTQKGICLDLQIHPRL